MIGGLDPREAAATEPLEEAPDGRAIHAQRQGDGGGALAPLPESEDGLTDRYGEGTWHGEASGVDCHESPYCTIVHA
jgi:hypothetical protein